MAVFKFSSVCSVTVLPLHGFLVARLHGRRLLSLQCIGPLELLGLFFKKSGLLLELNLLPLERLLRLKDPLVGLALGLGEVLLDRLFARPDEYPLRLGSEGCLGGYPAGLPTGLGRWNVPSRWPGPRGGREWALPTGRAACRSGFASPHVWPRDVLASGETVGSCWASGARKATCGGRWATLTAPW